MKVDSSNNFLTPTDLNRLDTDRTPESASSSSAAGASGTTQAGAVTDQVRWSSAVQLVDQAKKAADDQPAVRADKVAEAKQLLAEGKVGTNLDSLASSLIDAIRQGQ